MRVAIAKSTCDAPQVRWRAASKIEVSLSAKSTHREPHQGEMPGGGLVCRYVVVRPRDVVYVKGIVEASRGIATLHADAGGELLLVTTPSQQAGLEQLLDDLTGEIGLRRRHQPRPQAHRAFFETCS